MTPKIAQLDATIAPLRTQIVTHPLFSSLGTLEAMRRFMEHHVVAVWDFMTLLKSLQRQLTCIQLPWIPTPDPISRRLINEIVLAEESDIDPDGISTSHFELYLKAMVSAGAATAPILEMTRRLREGALLDHAILPIEQQWPAAARFIQTTWTSVTCRPLHEQAAVFAFGRENLIPDMFTEIFNNLRDIHPQELADFQYYLRRHIELDEDHHGPFALRMVTQLCGDDHSKWATATTAVQDALEARLALWDSAYSG